MVKMTRILYLLLYLVFATTYFIII